MIQAKKKTLEKRVDVDKDLLAVNAVHCKQLLLDTVGGYEDVIIDLKNVCDCDTAGVQLLVALKKTSSNKECNVRFCNVPEVVFSAANKWGLDLSTMFDIQR